MTPWEIEQARIRHSGDDRGAFAAALGVSPHTVQSWELGRRQPKAPTVAAIKALAPPAPDGATASSGA